jgi:hypothetical protein
MRASQLPKGVAQRAIFRPFRAARIVPFSASFAKIYPQLEGLDKWLKIWLAEAEKL